MKDQSVKRMPEKRLKTHQVKFRSTEAFYEAMAEAARRDTRTISSLLEKLMRDHLRQIGINPDEAKPRKR